MSKRQVTPDILSVVLTGEELPASRPSGQRRKKPVKRKTTKQLAPKKEVETEQGRGEEEVEKQKATFYLSETALTDLESAWMSLRGMNRGKGSVSKSGIVEAALRAALEEYESQGKNSALARALVD